MIRLQRILTIGLLAVGSAACGTIPYFMLQGVRASEARQARDAKLCHARDALRRLAIDYPPVGNLWILERGDENPCPSRGKFA